MIKATGDDQDVLLNQHTKVTDRINDYLIELQDDAYSLGRENSDVMCFLVGRWLDDETKPWEIQGIYDSEDDAKKACVGRNWFVMPTEKNIELPIESKVVGYYPNT